MAKFRKGPRCTECESKGFMDYHVTQGYMSSTLMYCPAFYDQDGEYHHHDGNTHTASYSCSKGHHWSEVLENRCSAPKCDWGKK